MAAGRAAGMGYLRDLGCYHFDVTPWKVLSSVNTGDFGFPAPTGELLPPHGLGRGCWEVLRQGNNSVCPCFRII